MEGNYKKNISEKQSMQDSFWEKQYTTQLLQGQDMLKLIQNLKRCGMSQIQLFGRFKTPYYMDKFLETSERQVNDELEQTQMMQRANNDKNQKPKRFMIISKQLRETHTLTTFQFQSGIHLQIFQSKYQQKLKSLENEYKYKIFPRGKYLQVYYNKKQGQFSSMFKNQIMTMKGQLKLYYCRDEAIIGKLRYSVHYRKILQKQNIQIKIQYYRRNNIAVFYSIDHEVKLIKQIITKKMLYHVTFVHMKDLHLTRQTNQAIFKLVDSSLKDKINAINQEYQYNKNQHKDLVVWIQANANQCCYAVHDMHEIFSIRPVQTLLRFIKNLFIFSLRLQNSRNLSNHLNSIKGEFPYVRYSFKRGKITFLINVDQIYQKQSLFLLLKQISKFVNNSPKISIYPRNFNYDKTQISRIMSIAESRYLDIQNFQAVSSKPTIAQIRLNFKNTDILSVRNQMSEFLIEGILKRHVQFNLATNKLFQCSYSKIVQKQASYSVSTANELFQDNQMSKSIVILFKMPQVDDTLKDYFQNGGLCKKTRQTLEAQLSQQTKRQVQLKVYNILVKSILDFEQSQIDPIPLVCKQILIKGSYLLQDVQIIQVSELKTGDICYIIFRINNKNPKQKQKKQIYVPSYVIKFI